MDITAADFQKVTGYTLVEQPGQALKVQVAAGADPIPVSEDALRALYDTYLELRGPTALPARSAALAETRKQLKADLNRLEVSWTPFHVSAKEALSAHETLMRLSPADFNEVLADIEPKYLERYFNALAKADPYDVAKTTPDKLVQFVQKVALEADPKSKVGEVLLTLDHDARQDVQVAFLHLDGPLMVRFRDTVGEAAFVKLLCGDHPDTLIGAGLRAGEYPGQNINPKFKEYYALALKDELPLPAGINDFVFLLGPGLFGDNLPGYLEINKRALHDWGVQDVEFLDYNTAASAQQNGDDMHRQILGHTQRLGKRAIPLGHSKFGRDSKEMFLDHPDLDAVVGGALLMEPAQYAQIAPDIKNSSLLAKKLDTILYLVGGNRAAFESMAEPAGRAYPTDRIPTVTYAATYDGAVSMMRPATEHYYGHHYHTPSDGAVELSNQVAVAGSKMVVMPGGADHAMPGLCLADAAEHFAVQLDAGAPDDVVQGIMDRLVAMDPTGIARKVLRPLRKHLSDPSERAELAAKLREWGPKLDAELHKLRKRKGQLPLDAAAATKALVACLFDEMKARAAA